MREVDWIGRRPRLDEGVGLEQTYEGIYYDNDLIGEVRSLIGLTEGRLNEESHSGKPKCTK